MGEGDEDEGEQIIRIILQQAQNTAAELIAYSMSAEASMNAHYLYIKKGLPAFYFTQAANDTGVPRRSTAAGAPATTPARSPPNDRRLLLMSEILCRVKLRIHRSPPGETYQGALERLRLRVEELKDTGITHKQDRPVPQDVLPDPHRHHRGEQREQAQAQALPLGVACAAEERGEQDQHPHPRQERDFPDVRTGRNMEPVPPPPTCSS